MKLSRKARREAKQLFRQCIVEGRMSADRVRRVVNELIERKPRGYYGMLVYFHHLVKVELQREQALVESAVPLAEPLRQALKENLNRTYGREISVDFEENPDLLGGVRVQVGSDVYDSTVRHRLDRLRDSF